MAMYHHPTIVLVFIVISIQVNGQRFRSGQQVPVLQNNFFSTNNAIPQRAQQQQQQIQQSFPRNPSTSTCAESNGRYPTGQCDAYIECKDGVGEQKLCPDGLLFNPAAGVFAFPCQYPIDVDCQGRSTLQPPQSTEDCPHQFGYYRIGDRQNCGQFKNCVDGRAFIFDCPEGLAFDESTYRCNWPDQVADCDAEAFLGFSCPQEPNPSSGLGASEYKFFRSPADCQRYFICIEGRPRLYNCGEGRAFNDLINACDGVENVTSCGGSVPQFNRQTPGGATFNRNDFNNVGGRNFNQNAQNNFNFNQPTRNVFQRG